VGDYRAKAIEGAEKVAAELERRAVRVVVNGSPERGVFEKGSDVDFVGVECPDRLSYAIENSVQVGLDGIPFDFIHQDEIRARRLRRFREGAVCARERH
jgi:predicted nucleotidyltransferase